MSSPSSSSPAPGPLQLGIVLGAAEEECTIVGQDGRACMVPFAAPFPRPRAERVAPGQLVAIVTPPGRSSMVIWRWFDAVVLHQEDGHVTLWEPGHGEIRALARDAARVYRPGGRAYVSAGLAGADWWVAGPAVTDCADACVDLDEVRDFFTSHDLWRLLA